MLTLICCARHAEITSGLRRCSRGSKAAKCGVIAPQIKFCYRPAVLMGLLTAPIRADRVRGECTVGDINDRTQEKDARFSPKVRQSPDNLKMTPNIKHVVHFHAAVVLGRHEVDDSQELNYPAIMRAFSITGYNGYVRQEFTPTLRCRHQPIYERIYRNRCAYSISDR